MRHIVRPLVQRRRWSLSYGPNWLVTWPLGTGGALGHCSFTTWAEAYRFARRVA